MCTCYRNWMAADCSERESHTLTTFLFAQSFCASKK